MSNQLRTPAAQVRGLGSAKSGTQHYIRQRVSAIALLFLVPWFVVTGLLAMKGGYASALGWVASPLNAILITLTLGAAIYHMRLGMQTVIEDYLAKTSTRQGVLILSTFFCIALFAATALSVLKIWISAG